MQIYNVMTADKLANDYYDIMLNNYGSVSDLADEFRKFAKYHVKLALQEALESIPCLGSSTDIATYEEVKEAVLNSYNLDNIK